MKGGGGGDVTIALINETYHKVIGAYRRHDPKVYAKEIERLSQEHCTTMAKFIMGTLHTPGNESVVQLPKMPVFDTIPDFFRGVVLVETDCYDQNEDDDEFGDLTPPPSPLVCCSSPTGKKRPTLKRSPKHVDAEAAAATKPLFARRVQHPLNERQRLHVLSHLLDDIGTCPTQWTLPSPLGGGENRAKRPKMRQGNKETRPKYTDTFNTWVENTSNLLAGGSYAHGTQFTLSRRSSGAYITGPDPDTFPETLNDNLIRIPKDSRCMGCRRYYLSPKDDGTKMPTFHLCDCPVSASYCIRCKIIQWAVFVDDMYRTTGVEPTHETRIPCVLGGCRGAWCLGDLMFLCPERQKTLGGK